MSVSKNIANNLEGMVAIDQGGCHCDGGASTDSAHSSIATILSADYTLLSFASTAPWWPTIQIIWLARCSHSHN